MRSMFLIILATGITILACKSDKKQDNVGEKKEITDAYVIKNQKGLAPVEIETMRKSAAETLAYRKKESGNKSYTVMDKDFWVFGGFVNEEKSLFGDSLGGAWIDFKENLTYDYGKFANKGGSGHYFYDLENATILMLDDNPAIKPQEFDVKIKNDMVVIVGRSTYKDNNIQGMLERKVSLPVKTSVADTLK